MDGFLTVGQPAAVEAVRAMLGGSVPHAILLTGPASVGKHALALDLAAALLCTGADGGERPCGTCRGCRMVRHGNHGDLHVVAPEGPGGQIRIGNQQDPEPGTVRWLRTQLALLPVEGGQRVAIIRDAHRMNEDAQSALLKTLEEPPAGATLLLLADDEERLLPTVRSRCARVRLGSVAVRDVERLLASMELADPPAAARLARLTAGRSGLAVAYANAPEAEAIRGELARTLLDLLREGRAVRLGAAASLVGRARTLAALLAPGSDTPEPPRRRGRGRASAAEPAPASGRASGPATADAPAGADGPTTGTDPGEAPGEAGSGRLPAAERRRAVATLLDAWRDVARDLVLAEIGARSSIREIALLEELEAAAHALPPGAASAALARLSRAGELLEANVSPDLLVDVLLLRWPRPASAA